MDEKSLGKNMLIASFNSRNNFFDDVHECKVIFLRKTIILCIVVKNFILKD